MPLVDEQGIPPDYSFQGQRDYLKRDFQDAEIQDDADRYTFGYDALIERSRCASDTNRSLSEKIEPG